MKNLNKIILPVTATALAFGVTNCKKSDTDMLVGQWEITEMDGDLEDMMSSDYDYTMNLEFHLEGDAEFCMLSEGFKYCSIGDWEWDGDNQLYMEFSDGDGILTIDINSITEDEITGEMTIENEDGDEYSGDVTLERVYVDKSALVDSKKK